MIPSGHCSEENQAEHYRVVGEGGEVKPVTVGPARHGHGHGDIMIKSDPIDWEVNKHNWVLT